MTKIVSRISKVSKVYQGKTILNNLSLEIKEGEIIGLVGENGSGKTTLIKILLGLKCPSEGSVQNFETSKKDKYLEFMGYVSDQLIFYDYFTVEESLRLISSFYKECINIELLLNYTDLLSERNKLIKHLSLGQKQRLNLALALVNRPKLILLDEPFNGLDPIIIQTYRNLIFKMRTEYNTSFFISSHNLHELANICDKVLMLKNGSFVEEVDLLERNEKVIITICFNNYEVQKIVNILKEVLQVSEIKQVNRNTIKFIANHQVIPQLNAKFIENGVILSTIQTQKEDLFNLFAQRGQNYDT